MENRNERRSSIPERQELSIEARRAEARRRRRKQVQRQRIFLGVILLLVIAGIVFAGVTLLGRRTPKGQKILPEGSKPAIDAQLSQDSDGQQSAGNTQEPAQKNAAEDAAQQENTAEDAAHQTDDVSDGDVLLQLSESDKYTGDLILVNSEYPYHVEENSEGIQLVDVEAAKSGDYILSQPDIQLAGRVVAPLDQMIAACEAETGSHLTGITSAYRSVERQQEIYEEYTAEYGLEYAQAYVANPGYSEHHTGLAMDLGIYYADGSADSFSDSAEAVWYADNSYRFGFVLRYEASKTDITGISNEEWHFRYVGIPHAYYMYEHDLCLEEYVDWLRNNSSESSPVVQACGEETYGIFFTTDAAASLPAGSEYSVSGNNVDGYVITYRMQ